MQLAMFQHSGGLSLTLFSIVFKKYLKLNRLNHQIKKHSQGLTKGKNQRHKKKALIKQ